MRTGSLIYFSGQPTDELRILTVTCTPPEETAGVAAAARNTSTLDFGSSEAKPAHCSVRLVLI